MNAPLLLDTCAAIWIFDNARMSREAVEAMDRASDLQIPTFISPISAWEIGSLATRKSFRSTLSPDRWFHKLTETHGIQLTELPPQVLIASCFLPGRLNRDPVDRIIAATAREYGLTVMTRDRALLDYAKEGHLSALEC
ncbi:MAG: type II toxin-antitoxin system VapC family toxin [Proteobacteria bacterium]|nr:type II toxin-antitoxin system VapC family toxin [Pseudomonadota bacterium]